MKAESGGGVLGEGIVTPFPPDRESGERYVRSPSGVRGGAQTAQMFSTTFSTQDRWPLLTDTIVLLIVDYHAAIGGGGNYPLRKHVDNDGR